MPKPALKQSRKRTAPKDWCDVFTNLARGKADGFTTQDVRRQITKLDLPINSNSLQVKLSKYVAKGYLRKAGYDKFFMTEAGQFFFRVPMKYDGSEEDYMTAI